MTIKGVGENSWLKASYLKDANIEIERVQFKWPFIVADITDQVVIGLDVLSAHNALIKASTFKEYKLRERYLKLRGI